MTPNAVDVLVTLHGCVAPMPAHRIRFELGLTRNAVYAALAELDALELVEFDKRPRFKRSDERGWKSK